MIRIFSLKILLLLTLFLSACFPSRQGKVVVEPVVTIPAAPTATLTEAAQPSATPLAKTTAEPPSPTSTATATAAATHTPALEASDPIIITNDFTNIRQGPGLDYKVVLVLAADTAAPIVGQNSRNDWWAIPGPGDGPGPVGWVSAAVVSVEGDVSSVPVLPAPPLAPDLPLMGNTGQPAAEVCTLSHPGPGDTGPLYLYAEPAENASAIIAQFGVGRWVTVIGRDNDWYHVQDAAGVEGWMPVTQVAHNGLCQPDDGPGSLPLIENPGAPPTDICLANRPGQFPPPDIHAGPGRQFALVARLGNWAEVLQLDAGWYQIVLGLDDVGWIASEDIDLTGPCPTAEPVPERIQFGPGETAITLEGMLAPPRRQFYLFRASAGQQADIEIVSESNQANFALSGVSDGQPYKRLEDELPSWSAELPATQDYLLTVAAPADAPTTGYRLFLTIQPLETP